MKIDTIISKMLTQLSMIGILGLASMAQAEVSVLTTVSDLNAIVQEVGGKEVKSESLCKGSQDPHYVEPKPSFMLKANKADLMVSIGLGLEIGWLPSIIQGARNPKIQPGQPGFLEVGRSVTTLEVQNGKVTRAEGDVHPEGNPHITLDPIRAGELAQTIAKRLGEIDPPHAALYKSRADVLQKRLVDKTKGWGERISKTGVKQVVSFHKTLTYFFDRFNLQNPMILEPLPGVPPTAKHTMEVIERAKADKINLIMVENFFDATVANRIAKDVPGLRVEVVPVSVDGEEKIRSIDDLYEYLVSAIEGKAKHG
ncbi:MAG: zinc ABC transporter substrate-binding protein [Oligoflexus sp.]|nr:zinc ABC transporter substrate-binding protein [Oligoflexus sp.]